MKKTTYILIAVMAFVGSSPAYAKKSKTQDSEESRPSYSPMTKTYVPSYEEPEEPEPVVKRGRDPEPEPEPVVTRSRGGGKRGRGEPEEEIEEEEEPISRGGKNNREEEEEFLAYTPVSSPKPTYTPASTSQPQTTSTRNVVSTRAPLVITKDNPLVKRGSIKFKDTLPIKYFNDWLKDSGESDENPPVESSTPSTNEQWDAMCRPLYESRREMYTEMRYANAAWLAYQSLSGSCKDWFGPAPRKHDLNDWAIIEKELSVYDCMQKWDSIKMTHPGWGFLTLQDIANNPNIFDPWGRSWLNRNLGLPCMQILGL